MVEAREVMDGLSEYQLESLSSQPRRGNVGLCEAGCRKERVVGALLELCCRAPRT
jgi:hypothetical protein